MAYCSDQAHSSVEKAGLIGLVKIRYIESDENLSLRGDKLKEAIETDRQNGYVPFFVRVFCNFLCVRTKNTLFTYTNNYSPLSGGSNFGFPARNNFFPGQ